MTVVRHTGRSTRWPDVIPDGMLMGPTLAAIGPIDAAGEMIAVCGDVHWSDRGTHDIRIIHTFWATCTAGSGSTRRASLQDIDLTNGPVMRPDGTPDQSFTTTTMPTSNTVTSDTLTADRASVAHGTRLAVVHDFSVFGATTSINIHGLQTADSRFFALEAMPTLLAGGTWTQQGRYALVWIEASDGTIGWITNSFPMSSTTITEAYNSGTNPDERGCEFTAEQPMEIDEIWCVAALAASADCDLILYVNGSAVATESIDANAIGATATGRLIRRAIAPTAIADGDNVRVMLKATTANNVTLSVYTIANASHRAAWGGTNFGYTTQNDGGGFAAVTTTKVPLCGVGISGFDDGAGGGGGGGLLSPNMRGNRMG